MAVLCLLRVGAAPIRRCVASVLPGPTAAIQYPSCCTATVPPVPRLPRRTYIKERDPKRVYYMSMEFLMGRSLLNALNNLGIKDQYTEAITELGYKLETLVSRAGGGVLWRCVVWVLAKFRCGGRRGGGPWAGYVAGAVAVCAGLY